MLSSLIALRPVLCCAAAPNLIGVRQTQTMQPTIPMASLMKLATVRATTAAAEAEAEAEAWQESLGQDRPRPSRPRLAQAKSVALEKQQPEQQQPALGETDGGSGERWPPVAPPRARKRQSMPFVRRGNATELAAAAATPIGGAESLGECPPLPPPSDATAEIDCLAKSAESSDGLAAASDEIKVAPETVRADNVLGESHESASRQPLASSTSAGALSSLFTKLLGKLPHDLHFRPTAFIISFGQR